VATEDPPIFRCSSCSD